MTTRVTRFESSLKVFLRQNSLKNSDSLDYFLPKHFSTRLPKLAVSKHDLLHVFLGLKGSLMLIFWRYLATFS
jgi:hypothetical protein